MNLIKTILTQLASFFGIAKEADKGTSSSEELVERIEITDTPFTVIKADGKWFVTMGKYRLTHELPGKKEAIENAKSIKWPRILQVITILMEAKEQEKHLTEHLKEAAEPVKKNSLNGSEKHLEPNKN